MCPVRMVLSRRTTSPSKPMPMISKKFRPLMHPTSQCTSSPLRSTSTSPFPVAGMSSSLASRFSVPAGQATIGTSVPARALAISLTVPSPPQTITALAWSAISLARRVASPANRVVYSTIS